MADKDEYQQYKGQIIAKSELTGLTKQLKSTDNGILKTTTMTNGDIPMILVDTTRETPIGAVLLANETYTSPMVDRPEQEMPDGYMRIWILADQSGNLYLEESHNGTNWTTTSSAVVSAGVSSILAWTKLSRRYSRCRYVNGATPQTSFIMIHYTKGVDIDPVMVADGDIATLGTKADAKNIDPNASASLNATAKGLLAQTQGFGTGAMPVSITRSLAETIQTHNAVSLAGGGSSVGTWIDTDGYKNIAGTLLNDANVSCTLFVRWSNDGVNLHSRSEGLAPTARLYGDFSTTIKARYVAFHIDNNDGVAHTMSAWAYLTQ